MLQQFMRTPPDQADGPSRTIVDRDQYNLSGNFPNAIININSTLEAVPEQITKASRYINMAPSPPQSFVNRDDLINALLTSIKQTRAHSSPNIIALRGAGGYGKSTLVSAICFHPSTRELFPNGVLWITLGEHYDSGKLVLQIADVIECITLNRPAFQAIDAASIKLRDIVQTGRFLFILDDVWHHNQIRPLLWPESPCVYMLTTRNHQTIPRLSRTYALTFL